MFNYEVTSNLNDSAKLSNILDCVHTDIKNAINVKDYFIKVLNRFGDNSTIVYERYPIYRLACNIYENYILESRSADNFYREFKYRLNSADNENTQKLENYIGYPGIEIYKTIRNYFGKYLLEYLYKRVQTNSNKSNIKFLAEGRKELASYFFSNISIIYGLRLMKENFFIFYYQPYYNLFKGLGNTLREACLKNLTKHHNFVVSFRFVNNYNDGPLIIFPFANALIDIDKYFNLYGVSYFKNLENINKNISKDVFGNAVFNDNLDMGILAA